MQNLRFAADTSGFHAAVKKRVDDYFERTAQSRTANAHMIAKTIFWIAAATACWLVAVFADVAAVALLAAIGLGFCAAAIGFNISHDAIHGAYSDRPVVNRMLGWTFQVLGASTVTWRAAHNLLHHTYTNVPDVDHDLDARPWLRLHDGQRAMKMHRLQHLYAWPLYTMTSLVWLVQKDFAQILDHERRTGKRATRGEIASVLAAKLIHLALFAALPLLLSSWSLLEFLVGYLAFHATAGLTLATVFQLAHVVEGPLMPRTLESWAAHEMRTTANFSTKSKLALFITGGLNHQVEHHLFPKVCHVHYPALVPIVRETAREFGLPYHEHRTFLDAVRSHARTLKRLGCDVEIAADGNQSRAAQPAGAGG